MTWTDTARALKREALVVYLVARHPETPWVARFVAALVVAYAFSPIDLIPDVIPVLGLLDDLLLVPLGVALVLRIVPAAVVDECRREARRRVLAPTSRLGAALVVAVWCAAAAGVLWMIG